MTITKEEAFDKDMMACLVSLKAFAVSLCGNVTRAEDLVQETVLRALANRDSFQPGTNMSAWLFTILRNHFRSEYRKRRREVEDVDGTHAGTLKQQPEQYGHIEFEEFGEALSTLPTDQREVLILVGASGFTYEQAASIICCAVGTVKSRLHRARTRLAELLDSDPETIDKRQSRYVKRQVAPYQQSPAPLSIKPDILFEGIGFVLERVESLRNGQMRTYYRAL